MAIDLCSDSSGMGISPRISFSHDLSQTDGVPIEQYGRTGSSSSVDFDFCVFRESFGQESSADELFSDGKILPIEIKRQLGAPKKTEPIAAADSLLPSLNVNEFSSREKKMEVTEPHIQKSNSKSFWGFKRSSSLNCGSGYARTLCPIPLLSRSNSTGSTSNGKKPSAFVKDNFSRLQKSPATASSKLSQQTSSSSVHQKPPLRKSYGPYGGNGVKFNPVINVPTPLLSGLSSIFSSPRDKNKKK